MRSLILSSLCLFMLNFSLFAQSNLSNEKKLINYAYNNKFQEIDLMLDDLNYSGNKRNFNINYKNRNGDSALIIAAYRKNYKTLKVLLSYKKDYHLDLEILSKYNDSALTLSAFKACFKCVTALVRAGAKIQNIGPEKKNALDALLNTRYDSNKKNILNIANYLFNLNINIHYRDKNRTSLLQKSIAKKLNPLAKILIEKGVRFNSKNKFGSTPLMTAASRDNLEILSLLIEEGAYLDIQNNKGHTALMYAVMNKSEKSLQILLNNDIDTTITNNDNKDALLISAERNYTRIYNFLIYKNIKSYNKKKAALIIKSFKEYNSQYSHLSDLTKKILKKSNPLIRYTQTLSSSELYNFDFSAKSKNGNYQCSETYNFIDNNSDYIYSYEKMNSTRPFGIAIKDRDKTYRGKNFQGIRLLFNTEQNRAEWVKELYKTKKLFKRLLEMNLVPRGVAGTSSSDCN